jgi:hypothetical protein
MENNKSMGWLSPESCYNCEQIYDFLQSLAEIWANGTAHENMILEMVENYNHNGFINHNRMLKDGFKAYRVKRPGINTDDPGVQAEVRRTVGPAPSKAFETRAREIIKNDLPILLEKPNFRWATDTTMVDRAKVRSGRPQERADAASADIKAAHKGRDALILRLLSQLSAYWVPELPVEWQTLWHTVPRSWETQAQSLTSVICISRRGNERGQGRAKSRQRGNESPFGIEGMRRYHEYTQAVRGERGV